MNQAPQVPHTPGCPRCGNVPLSATPAPNGVIVDVCPRCNGLFLDYAEVNYFVRQGAMDPYYQSGLIQPRQSPIRCPKDGAPMWEGGLLRADLQVDECSHCRGLWFDNQELPKLQELSSTLSRMQPIAAHSFQPQAVMSQNRVQRYAAIASMPGLPNLFVRSFGVLLFLYALLFGFMVLLTTAGGVSPLIGMVLACGVIFVQYLVGPFFMDFTLRWFNNLRWVPYEQLPPHLSQFVLRLSAENGVKAPRIGIISDFTPNAFTYGHVPGNARVVITEGLMRVLEPAELEAVVAHELGHARHWDILVMTLASMIPFVFYYMFRIALDVGLRARRAAPPFLVVALASFLLYVFTTYVVLFISRSREYYADRFAGVVTGNPNALASSLVKIAYGLVAADPLVDQAPEAERARVRAKSQRLRAAQAMGIFDGSKAVNLAMASFRGPNAFSAQSMVAAMQWDLWNPWALFYELGSTHPLPARRIAALGKLAKHLNQQPLVEFNEKRPESFWDEFFVDLFFKLAPWTMMALGFAAVAGLGAVSGAAEAGLGLPVLGFGFGYVLRLLFSYRSGEFPETSVSALLSKIKVSEVRPVPATLRGRVIGRGIPGLIWCEDLVVQDKTGFMFLDYRQPLQLIEWVFGMFGAGRLIGQDIVVRGWYRRAPTPYLEIQSLETAEGERKRSYTVYAKWVFAALVISFGLFLELAWIATLMG